VIGREDQFTQFLKEMNTRRQDLPAPLVALFEDENDLKSMKRKMPIDDGVFLMPMRQSKGMEFEDCILYRLFASISNISEDTGEDLIARLFDLWYMGVTRARKSLLTYLTPEDWSGVQKYFADHLDELLSLVDVVENDPLEALREFQEQSEKYVPNYNVIFLERVKAQEAWQEFRGGDRADLTEGERDQRREQALRLCARANADRRGEQRQYDTRRACTECLHRNPGPTREGTAERTTSSSRRACGTSELSGNVRMRCSRRAAAAPLSPFRRSRRAHSSSDCGASGVSLSCSTMRRHNPIADESTPRAA